MEQHYRIIDSIKIDFKGMHTVDITLEVFYWIEEHFNTQDYKVLPRVSDKPLWSIRIVTTDEVLSNILLKWPTSNIKHPE
jgi:hypothetical protein